MSDLSFWKVGFNGVLGGRFFLVKKAGPRERPSQGDDEALKTLHGELFAGHVLSPS